ncbi:MAG: response regulator transcription factor [Gemmatimonadaceae bacterium]
MSLRLSSADLAGLDRVMSLLLSPLAFERLEHWCRAVREASEPVVRAEKSLFLLRTERALLYEDDANSTGGYDGFRAYSHETGPGAARGRQRRLQVFRGWDIHDPPTFRRTDFCSDVVRRYKMLEPVANSVDVWRDGPPAFIAFYWCREGDRRAHQHALGVLRILLPAFKAGVGSARLRVPGGIAAGAMLGAGAPAAALFDLMGAALQADAGRARLSMGDPDAQPGAPLAAVVVDRVSAKPLAADELRRRYALTPREAQVAHLLSLGRGNAQVAHDLGTSIHTARRHVEHVLTKLGVHRRAEVGARLLGVTPGPDC